MEKTAKVYLWILIGLVICMVYAQVGDILTVHAETYGDFEYSLINNETEIEITGYNGSDTELVIPSEINGKAVTEIGDFAFQNYKSVTSVSIPSSINTIGAYAFDGCNGLTGELKIPEGVTSIGSAAFSRCSGLTGELEIPEKVTEIKAYAFNGCNGLTGKLKIPQGVTSIGDSAFKDCSSFTGNLVISGGVISIGREAFSGCSGFTGELVIPNGVTSIGYSAFNGCSGLTSVSIPASVTEISNLAFEACSGLIEIVVGDENLSYKSIDKILYDKEGKTLLYVPRGREGKVIIPEGVEKIGYTAFEHCSGVTQVEFPSSVLTIENFAFHSCNSLTEIIMPDGVEKIGAQVFSNCHNLKKIEIPASVIEIKCSHEDRVGYFIDNSNLLEINVHSENKEYESIDGVLYDREKKVLLCVPGGKKGIFCIPKGIEEINAGAFTGCDKLITVEVPTSVIKITWLSLDTGSSDKILDLIVTPGSYAETYAKENNIPYTYSGEKWTVTIKNSSGQVVKTLRVDKGGILSAPQPSEERTNETFLGFYNGDTKFDFSQPIISDVTLTEKWEEKKDNPENPVTPPQESGITLNMKTLSFDTIGVTQILTATVTPDTADKKVTWTSSDEKVATVMDGVVTSVGNGMAVITVKSADGKTAAATVTVSQKTTKLSIQLNGQSVSGTLKAKVKKSYRFKAVVTPSNADTKNAAVTWTSSNKKIATVTSKGKVTIKKAGKVTITAKTADGRKAAIKLNATKKAVKVTKLKITGSKTMKVKAKQTLVSKLSPATADNQKVTWKSSNKKIATVNSKGVVTAKKAGKVTITATAKDGSRKKATIKITVKK